MLKRIVIVISLILWPLNLILNFGKIHLSSETIFKNDYQGEQLVLRNIQLYPTPLMARTFQNKPRIYINKYVNNFFVLIDPNNYFFALHPEPIAGNINMFKFPFLDMVFFLIGIYYFKESRYKYLILGVFIPGVLILSAFKNFEGIDFILWIPISFTIINGINQLEKKNVKVFNYFSLVFVLFAIPDIVRSFFNK